MGMIWADAMRDYSLPVMSTLRPDEDPTAFATQVRSALDSLSARARDELGDAAVLEPAMDVRYAGQGYELTVPWSADGIPALLAGFHEEHRRRYGHADAARPVEVVTLRLRGRIPRKASTDEPMEEGTPDASAAVTSHRRLTDESGQSSDAPVYDREKLRAGNAFDGPALVSQLDSTTLVPVGWCAIVDAWGNLVIERAS
jgi:N-methylhydantoinase A